MTIILLTRRRRLPLLPLMRWPPNEAFRLTLPRAVTFTRLLKPLCGFCLFLAIGLFLNNPLQRPRILADSPNESSGGTGKSRPDLVPPQPLEMCLSATRMP